MGFVNQYNKILSNNPWLAIGELLVAGLVIYYLFIKEDPKSPKASEDWVSRPA